MKWAIDTDRASVATSGKPSNAVLIVTYHK